jgi:hypothetical protein
LTLRKNGGIDAEELVATEEEHQEAVETISRTLEMLEEEVGSKK